MSAIVQLENLRDRAKVCLAIGNFDGVHLGHQVLLERIRNRASEINFPAWVLTFSNHILKSSFKALPINFYKPTSRNMSHYLREISMEFS